MDKNFILFRMESWIVEDSSKFYFKFIKLKQVDNK